MSKDPNKGKTYCENCACTSLGVFGFCSNCGHDNFHIGEGDPMHDYDKDRSQ